MTDAKSGSWDHFQQYYTEFPPLGLAVDLSRMPIDDPFLTSMEPHLQKAFADMDALEKGAIANPDEKRMVGHYWLQDPNISEMLKGAKQCDLETRKHNVKVNPSSQLFLAIYEQGNDKVKKRMVALLFFDPLELFSKYLHQLFLESPRKELDLNNQIVNQGLSALGNKSSTDQVQRDIETVFKICEHLAAHPERKIVKSSDALPSVRKNQFA